MVEASLLGFVGSYADSLPSEALAGNVFAVSILLILFYITVIVINKLTDIILLLLKRLILLAIVSLAFYQFLQFLDAKLGAEGLTVDTIIFGGAGFIVGCIALFIAVHAAFSSLIKVRPGKKVVTKEEVEEPSKRIISMSALKEDRRLGVVIAYLVVAEFGVISSKTVAAPNVNVGVLFFAAFMIAALFFIYQSYRDFKTGIRHLLVALFVGGILSIVLGYFWGGYPLNELLSEMYFVSDSLVAFVTGIAVSLFMGSRG